MEMSEKATQALDPAALLSSAPWCHTCIVSWLGAGVLAWKRSPISVSYHHHAVPPEGVRAPRRRFQVPVECGVGNALQARRSGLPWPQPGRWRSAGKASRPPCAPPPPPAGALAPSTAAPATSACAVSTTTASGSTTAWARGTTVLKNHTDVWFVFLPAAPVETQAPAILALAALLILLGLLSTALLGHLLCFHIYLMWHKLTTYEYIVQHRLPQEAKGAHRELESCPPKMRPIQEMEFYMRTFSHVRPEPPGQARPATVNANLSQFLATRGQMEPPQPSSPETLPPRIRPQKKRKRRVYKVPTSGTLDRESPLPRLSGPRGPGRSSSSSSDSVGASPVHATGPAGAYHSASAESMDEIPVAQTRLGSAALAAPGGRGREPGLALQVRAPAVFVSPSSGDPGARGGPETGLP
ncbi:palmitoyltransferase ZDHHC1 isoform X4 [Panthera tigris]|uniref:palmitoyltransferase ZDHHC1 isoform X4 n=1 Tax=Panthera tigris TaxID=9694 RepID=UPI001C6F7D00|nr:palmitoyltransferase ZDHHC1 isoform X4 [Panthera tigris]